MCCCVRLANPKSVTISAGLFGRARSPRHGPPPKVTVYGGQLFREIRAASGVSDAEILGALGIRQVLGALLMGDLRGLGELVSEGKSGSLFCESSNGQPQPSEPRGRLTRERCQQSGRTTASTW